MFKQLSKIVELILWSLVNQWFDITKKEILYLILFCVISNLIICIYT